MTTTVQLALTPAVMQLSTAYYDIVSLAYDIGGAYLLGDANCRLSNESNGIGHDVQQKY